MEKGRNHTCLKGEIMNKRQLVAMWIGIAIIVLVACGSFSGTLNNSYGWSSGHVVALVKNPGIFLALETIVIAITLGLLATLADKKGNKT
jgi:hypothetical protein